MRREILLNELRDLYRAEDWEGLRRRYLLGAFILTEEDKKKIELVLSTEKAKTAARLSEGARIVDGHNKK